MIKVHELQDQNDVSFIQGDYFFKPKFKYCNTTNSLVLNTDSTILRKGEKLNKHGGTLYKIEICTLGNALFDKFKDKDNMSIHVE